MKKLKSNKLLNDAGKLPANSAIVIDASCNTGRRHHVTVALSSAVTNKGR